MHRWEASAFDRGVGESSRNIVKLLRGPKAALGPGLSFSSWPLLCTCPWRAVEWLHLLWLEPLEALADGEQVQESNGAPFGRAA